MTGMDAEQISSCLRGVRGVQWCCNIGSTEQLCKMSSRGEEQFDGNGC